MISLSLMQRTSLKCATTRTLTFMSGCDIQLVLVTLTLEERISQTKKTYLSISTCLSSTILQLCITEQSVANLRSKTALKCADNGLESSNENVSSMLLIFLKTIMCLPVKHTFKQIWTTCCLARQPCNSSRFIVLRDLNLSKDKRFKGKWQTNKADTFFVSC